MNQPKSLNTKVHTFTELSLKLVRFISRDSRDEFDQQLESAIGNSFHRNGWFTEDNVKHALSGIVHMLDSDKLTKWFNSYDAKGSASQLNVGIIMAGNIPLVGFHDLLCVLMSGHKALVKMSSDDELLLPVIVDQLKSIDPDMGERIHFVQKLQDFDAVIATGSNSSAGYFSRYFSNVPHLIRKNRNSLAVLSGNESEEELKLLGEDIFRYYGLGCRNVSKLYVPLDYDLDTFFGSIVSYEDVINHHKYANNYNYYKAFYIMNKEDLIENGFLMLKHDVSLHSPVSLLFYDRYSKLDEVRAYLKNETENVQCVISDPKFLEHSIPFGKSQMPELWDYADGIDTMEFLSGLNG